MKRALISVYDKSGVVEFAKELADLGWEIVSTGGTFETLKSNGLNPIKIEDVTKFQEILDGRVKTLNPLIHGGILYRRDKEDHKKTINKMDISPIDIIVNNLYPFEETISSGDKDEEEIIENIDIGGPSMIRAGAKNYRDVTVIIDPTDYKMVLNELKVNNNTSINTRRYLARKVFNYTAYYDTLISNYFNEIDGENFPDHLTFAYKNKKQLRYGENPHQNASFYEEVKQTTGTLSNAIKLHGKELSFNNINDSNGALETLKEFEEPTVVGVKHGNPCGIGSDSDINIAYKKAYEADSASIFGGIIAVNREVGVEIAERINSIFIEIVMAPSYTNEALEILKKKENIRILKIENIMNIEYTEKNIKKVLGGILIQDRDDILLDGEIITVTDKKPSQEDMENLLFAWKVSKCVKSNGVAIVKDKATIGLGLGEVNRAWAVENAIARAGEKVVNSYIASDGFFPFKDSIEMLAKAKIKAIIQPGGSIKDKEVIDEANKNGIIMCFTGIRHFKH